MAKSVPYHGLIFSKKEKFNAIYNYYISMGQNQNNTAGIINIKIAKIS